MELNSWHARGFKKIDIEKEVRIATNFILYNPEYY